MIKERTFHGSDVNKVTSLFEYGLLMRWMPKRQSWQCIYWSECTSGITRYSYGWIDEKNSRRNLYKKLGRETSRIIS